MLPWIAVPLGAAGAWMALRANAVGWWLVAASAGLLALDLLITLVWSKKTRARSDQPLLNRREAQYVGRRVRVVEAITGGEGKVRVADTVWRARGPDCAAGTWVSVVAAEGSYLVVCSDETTDRGASDLPTPP